MLRNIPLRTKLLLILVLPVLGFLAFSSIYVSDKYQTLREMSLATKASAEALEISQVITTLQRERGASGVFISSRGAAMRDELGAFRDDSDEAIRQMRSRVNQQTPLMSETLRALEMLPGLRDQVNALSLNGRESGARYTATINLLIDYTQALEANINDPELLRLLSGLNEFVEMKERAGRERALLGMAFAQNSFDVELLTRFSKNLGEFGVYLDAFERRAPAELKTELEEIMQLPVSQQVASRQRLAVETPIGEALGMKPQDWFKLSTERIDLMGRIEEELGQQVNQLAVQDHKAALRNVWLAVAALLVVIIAVASLTYLIIRNINSGVSDLNDTLIALAGRDLTAQSRYQGSDEFGKIAANLNNVVQHIRDVIQDIGSAATQVATAAEQSSSVAMQTSQNVAQQRQGTDQVATAINQMSATVRDVACSTTEAAEMSRQVNDTTAQGKAEIVNTVRLVQGLSSQAAETAQLIQELKKESDAISSVIDVIRGVAEQTNLLALNAAIEAARAGDQGRGFAVVADEVRQLAQKTQESTVSIQHMISNLQSGSDRAANSMRETLSKAESGASNVVKAGDLLETIAEGIASISDRNIQVASAAEEQSLVSEEINRNVNDINDLVIQVSAGAEQTASTSRELARLAAQQQQLVSRFKIA